MQCPRCGSAHARKNGVKQGKQITSVWNVVVSSLTNMSRIERTQRR